MGAYDDLRNVLSTIDSVLVGWIGNPIPATTKTGAACLDLVARIQKRHYKDWGENIALRARLSRALSDNEGLRDANALMTDQIERLEQPVPRCQEKLRDF